MTIHFVFYVGFMFFGILIGIPAGFVIWAAVQRYKRIRSDEDQKNAKEFEEKPLHQATITYVAKIKPHAHEGERQRHWGRIFYVRDNALCIDLADGEAKKLVDANRVMRRG